MSDLLQRRKGLYDHTRQDQVQASALIAAAFVFDIILITDFFIVGLSLAALEEGDGKEAES